ncbi:hypothetical protein B0I35DRAFT_409851 [Stachybotrys elegans]|uniref:Uncharacterized protein n=1 Tax=Stachybotrys elegans TaxID=80388 RepID=A0A8K0SQU9_9HYPO|nr:hypothetical protein B0I35DRAFT_409851 [Stachybotrys elegans]
MYLRDVTQSVLQRSNLSQIATGPALVLILRCCYTDHMGNGFPTSYCFRQDEPVKIYAENPELRKQGLWQICRRGSHKISIILWRSPWGSSSSVSYLNLGWLALSNLFLTMFGRHVSLTTIKQATSTWAGDQVARYPKLRHFYDSDEMASVAHVYHGSFLATIGGDFGKIPSQNRTRYEVLNHGNGSVG